MIGRKIIHLERVDSTNNYIANLISKKEILDGTVVLADEQSCGRGQRGNLWLSEAGVNLLFSTYIESVILSVSEQFFLTKMVALSIVNFLNDKGVKSIIKWPNDILVQNKKIAGVLIENQVSGHFLKSSVIGIGLNVNQLIFPIGNVTSLQLELKEFASIHSVALGLVFYLNKYWEHIANRDFSKLNELYLHNLHRLNQVGDYQDEFGDFKGVIEGVSDDGKLILKSTERDKLLYDLKEVTFI